MYYETIGRGAYNHRLARERVWGNSVAEKGLAKKSSADDSPGG